MSTIKEWLNSEGFDWDNGVIVYQPVEDNYPGWCYEESTSEIISNSHPILNYSFSSGYGGPDCPRFVAYDRYWIYFPYQYDGSTGIVKVATSPNYYVNNKTLTPYPGE